MASMPQPRKPHEPRGQVHHCPDDHRRAGRGDNGPGEMKRWEYKSTTNGFDAAMNELGGLGWELVCATYGGGTEVFYWKREMDDG